MEFAIHFFICLFAVGCFVYIVDEHFKVERKLKDQLVKLRSMKIRRTAEEVFGNYTDAAIWFHSPNIALGGTSPSFLIYSDEGEELVLKLLFKLQYDMMSGNTA
jgi:uncharacterized protein (DUF2384 family)